MFELCSPLAGIADTFPTTSQALLDEARSLSQSDYERAKQLAIRSIQAAQESVSKESETNARLFLLDLIKGRGFGLDPLLYKEQLDHLETLPFEHLDQGKKWKILVDLGRGDFALSQRQPAEAVRYARKGLQAATEQNFSDLIHSGQLLLGLALVVDRIDQQYVSPTDPVITEAQELLKRGLSGPIHPAFEVQKHDGRVALSFVYEMRGDIESAKRLRAENIPSVSTPPVAKAYYYLFESVSHMGTNKQLALEQMERALQEIQEERDPIHRGGFLLRTIGIWLSLDQQTKAESIFDQALGLLGSNPAQIDSIIQKLNVDILPVIRRFSLVDSGMHILESFVALLESRYPHKNIMPFYASLGKFYASTWDKSSNERFVKLVEKAEVRFKNERDFKALQDLYLSQASTYFLQPRYSEASYRLAIMAGDLSGNNELLFSGMRKAMLLALDVGNYQDTVDLALIALSWAATILDSDPHDAIMECLIDISTAMTALGRFDLAHNALYYANLRLPKANKDWNEFINLSYASLLSLLGDTAAAGAFLSKIQFSEVKHLEMEQRRWSFFYSAGEVLAKTGDYLRAENLLRQCIDYTTRAVRLFMGESFCRWTLHHVLNEIGDYEAATKEIRDAYGALNKSKRPSLQFYELQTESLFLALRDGHKPDSLEWANMLLAELAPMPPSPRTLSYLFAARAAVIAIKGRAAATLQEVGAVKRNLDALVLEPYLSVREYRTLMRFGIILSRNGFEDLAIDALKALTERVEYARNLLALKENRQAFGAAINELFELQTNIYLRKGDATANRKALLVYESNKARSTNDLRLSVESQVNPTGKERSTTEGPIETARNEVEAIGRQPGGLGSRQSTEAAGKLFNAKFDPRNFNIASITGDARRGLIPQLQQTPSLDLAALQSKLDGTVAVILYHLSNEFTGAWVVTHTAIQWRPLAPKNQLETIALRYRTELLSFESNSVTRLHEVGKSAYTEFLGPLANDIAGKTRLVIVPDGILYSLPFEALVLLEGPLMDRFLIEKYQISYQLSLGLVLQSLSGSSSQLNRDKRVLVLANPSSSINLTPRDGNIGDLLPALKYVKKEMDNIVLQVGPERSTTFYGEAATKEAFLKESPNHQIIHIASHAIANEHNPWGSAILLSGKEGTVSLYDVSQTKLSAELVVLSACDTGRGRIDPGEGVWGFQSQFLASGARNVVVSLWRVADESTAELMEQFYNEMKPEFVSFAPALREAKLKLLKNDRTKHPYFWASFAVYGGVR